MNELFHVRVLPPALKVKVQWKQSAVESDVVQLVFLKQCVDTKGGESKAGCHWRMRL